MLCGLDMSLFALVAAPCSGFREMWRSVASILTPSRSSFSWGTLRERRVTTSSLNSGNCSAFWCIHFLTGAKPLNPTLLPFPAWNPVFCHSPHSPAYFPVPPGQPPPEAGSSPSVQPLWFPPTRGLSRVPCHSPSPGTNNPLFVGCLPKRKEGAKLVLLPGRFSRLQTSMASRRQRSLTSHSCGVFVRGARKGNHDPPAEQKGREQREPSQWAATQGED